MDSQNNLKKIIKIIHPQIRKRLDNFIKKNKHKKFIVLDIPLLMENKINKKNDIIVFVDSKKKEINKRLKKRYKGLKASQRKQLVILGFQSRWASSFFS